MTFENNIIMQVCAVLGLIATSVVLIVTFVPSVDFEDEVAHPNFVRAAFVIVILGLLRGSF